MLQYNDGQTFASSRSKYLDKMGGFSENRIHIVVQFDSLPKDLVVVDTGAPWCVLSKEQAKELNPDYKNEAIETRCLNVRGESTEGVLIRIPITICAEQGEDITIEGTVFIPEVERDIPNFIGLDGFLNRIRFAIDPQINDFYFGHISK